MGFAEIHAALLKTNEERCRPPLSAIEVDRIARSVSRYEPDQIAVAVAENHYGQDFGSQPADEDEHSATDPGSILEDLLRIPGFISEVMDFSLETAPYPNSAMAFCGAVGNHLRREYTMHGDGVNLAARLMQDAPGAILCDTATYLAARDTVAFEELPPITVKGKTGQIAVYRPTGLRQIAPRRQTELVDRSPERARMQGWLQTLQQGHSAAAVIEGEAGIGKSRLAAELLLQTRAAGLAALTGGGSAINRSTPYHAWRPIFRQLLKLDSLADDPAVQRAWVLDRLHTLPPGESGDRKSVV